MLRVVSIFLFSLFIFACSSNETKDEREEKKEERKATELESFDKSVKAKRLWKAGAGEGDGRKYLRLAPSVFGDVIYTTDSDGVVRAFSLADGKRRWKTDTNAEVSGGVGAYLDTVAVGTFDGKVIALSADSGDVRWEAQTSSEILAVPAVSATLVVVQTIDARVFAFDSKSGELRWSYDHLTPVLSLRGTSSPLINGNQVICAFDNGQIISFSLIDGSRTWEARVSHPKGKTDLERIVDIDGTPAVKNGLVYSGSYQGNLFAFALAKGNPIWKQELSTYRALSVSNGKVFVSTADSHVIAYNASNGDVVWKNEDLQYREIGAPTTVGRYVATIDGDGYLHILSQQDGQFVERLKPAGDGFNAPMMTHLGKLYILSDDGKLSAYELSSR
ncbi:MAG: outer membrane protein assembly factor BamB [Agarilytica sp.]